MRELLSTEQMIEADRLTVERGTESFLLMKAAGEAVASEAKVFAESFPVPLPITILCGPGNNGGDGFVAAKFLKDNLKGGGDRIRVACLVDPEDLKGDAAEACAFYGGEVLSFESLEIDEGALVIDAVFGTGFSGNFDDSCLTLFHKIIEAEPRILSVDVPSGLNASTGEVVPFTPRADKTVTFFKKKRGHILMPGATHCGEISVHDIGISDSVIPDLGGDLTYENIPDIWSHYFPLKREGGHKYDSGHSVLLGGRDMTGAASLAARAAMRMGAGLCSIVTHADARDVYRNYMPELVVEVYRGMADFHMYLDMPRRNAILLGSGAGLENPKALRKAVFDSTAHGEKKACILDGDVFSVFAEDPKTFYKCLHEKCVLTPHSGEFERIFPNLPGCKIKKAKEAARLSGATIVLKGADTIIASPDGRTVINGHASPYLATAGAGDVLAGLILGLLTQHVPPFEAACAAVWLHGEASYRIGVGLIASDLPDIIPHLLEDFA